MDFTKSLRRRGERLTLAYAMGRKDPIAKGRRHIRGRMYVALALLRLLSCLPSAYPVFRYFSATLRCFNEKRGIPESYHCSPDMLLPGVWCLVSSYMTYLALDGMMVRWIVMYSPLAAIIRTLSCIIVNFVWIHFVTRFHGASTIDLQIWILISCMSTAVYILQSFITSNMATRAVDRTLNLFHIAVYAVVPIGLASFITMIALIRTLMLVQLMSSTSEIGGDSFAQLFSISP